MRRRVTKHKYPNYARRIVRRYIWWPTKLRLSKQDRTPLIQDEWRWMEWADIVQFYSHWNSCWIDSEWASDKRKIAKEP